MQAVVEQIGAEVVVSVISTLLVSAILAFLAWLALRTKFNKRYREATNHLRKGEALQREGQLEPACVELKRTVDLLSDELRSRLLGEAYLRLADVHMGLRDWDKAIENYVLCREAIRNLRGDVREDAILLKLGKAYFEAEKLEDAFRCFDEARRQQEIVQDHPLLGETYSRLGEIESQRNHLGVAIEHYQRALISHEKLDDLRSVAGIRVSLGELHSKKGNERESVDNYFEAARIFHDVGDVTIAKMLEDMIGGIDLQEKSHSS